MRHQSIPPSVTVYTPILLLVTILLSCMGAIIGIQIILTLGISANTSIIGAALAIMLSKLPLSAFRLFKQLEAQNLVQTAISSATFSAANGLLISIGVPWVLGWSDLVWPMFTGASLAIIVDGTMLYGLFNSHAFPASGPWPSGVATAETLWASDRGGKKLYVLCAGFVLGAGGAYLGIPMASAGVALLGSFFALFMFAVGLLLRGFSETGGIHYDLYAHYAPHGLMIGAGLVALVQVILIIVRDRKKQSDVSTTTAGNVKSVLLKGAICYFCIALLLAVTAQLFTIMSLPMLMGFLLFAMCAAIIQEMIVGMAAMHSGWFPAAAVALISLVIGITIGFPPRALAVLVGFCVATGPSFADLGFDLKTGFMIRGYGKNPTREQYGRRQQYFAALIGFVCAIVMVALTHKLYFSQGLAVPTSRAYAATIQASSSSAIAQSLLLWAFFGAVLQWIGGSRHQLGILFSTGLMIHYSIAGWTVLAALAVRFVIERLLKVDRESISAVAGGLIAGSALYSSALVFAPMLKAKIVTLFHR